MPSIFGRSVIVTLTNKSGGEVFPGDVVIIDTANNDACTTTTTGAFTGGIGIVQEWINTNVAGRVLISGYAALVNVNASVTRGHYGVTHTVAKQATDGGASRLRGGFCEFLTGGTTPTALLFGFPEAVPQPPWAIVPMYGAGVTATSAIGAANRAVYVPVIVPAPCTITGCRLNIVNATGNGDVGLYDSAGNRLASRGAGAWPGTGIRDISFSASYAAEPGRYFLAMAASSNTATFRVQGLGELSPVRFQETAYPLPNPATLAGQHFFNVGILGLISGASLP